MLKGGSANARSTQPAGRDFIPAMQSPWMMRLSGGSKRGASPLTPAASLLFGLARFLLGAVGVDMSFHAENVATFQDALILAPPRETASVRLPLGQQNITYSTSQIT